MPELEVTRIQYGPNPFSIQQGGLFSFEFSVLFANGTPPDTFTYDIYAMSPAQEVMKHWTDTVSTYGVPLEEVDRSLVGKSPANYREERA